MKKLSIPNALLEKNEYLAVVIYALLEDACLLMERDCKMPYEYLYLALYNTTKPTEKQRKDVTTALKELPMVLCNKQYMVIPVGSLRAENDFVIINYDEFDTITNHSSNKRLNYSLFYYWCNVVKTFDWNIEAGGKRSFMGHMPVSYLAEQTGVTEPTVFKYNKILEDLKIIYIHRRYYNSATNTRPSNNYGRYEDKDLIMKVAADDSDNMGNFKRSVSARYNAYLKNPASVDFEKLRVDVGNYNRYVEESRKIHLT